MDIGTWLFWFLFATFLFWLYSSLLAFFIWGLFSFFMIVLFLQSLLKFLNWVFMAFWSIFDFLLLFVRYSFNSLIDFRDTLFWLEIIINITFGNSVLIIGKIEKEIKKPFENRLVYFFNEQILLKLLMNVTVIRIKFNWHLVLFVSDSTPVHII